MVIPLAKREQLWDVFILLIFTEVLVLAPLLSRIKSLPPLFSKEIPSLPVVGPWLRNL